MKALILREAGSIEGLRYEDASDPVPGENDVLVSLKAAALNHRDVFICQGLYPGIKPPVILGSDGAGEVIAVGAGAGSSWLGKQVVINPCFDWGENPRAQSAKFRLLGLPDDGTNAQLIKVPAANLAPKPSKLSYEQAAALPLAALTAYRAVVTRAQVKTGEKVLVTGIGGGVALFALQFAKSLGATVYVTSGSEEKIERARNLGATGGVSYRNATWGKELIALSGGGPDVVIDSTGGDTFNKALEVLKPGGRLVTYGSTLGAVEKMETRRIFWKQLNVLGSTMGTDDEFAEMLKFYETRGLEPVIDSVHPLEEGKEAYLRMQEARQFGKIVLKIA
jgi:NADPH:quinone reductase-like Zn-dependent oxidoreductase